MVKLQPSVVVVGGGSGIGARRLLTQIELAFSSWLDYPKQGRLTVESG